MNQNHNTDPWMIEDAWHLRLMRILLAPHSSIIELGEKRRAQLLSILALIFSGVLMLALVFRPAGISSFVVMLVVGIVSYVLSRTQYYWVGLYFFSFGITATAYLSLWLGTARGFESAITTTAHVSLITASILLSFRGFIALVVFATMATFAAPLYSPLAVFGSEDYFRTAGVLMSIGLILVGAYGFRAWIERERVKEVSDVNRELEKITDQLEDRVKERTVELDQLNRATNRHAVQLQTIAELAQTIAQVQNSTEIFSTAARLISERFGFYHVGIFLIDSNREYAVLQSANSSGGQKMLARGHRLLLGTGVVGFSAQTGKPRIALDTGKDAVFFNNPDLPETRSEIALPLIVSERTFGILDVQSTDAGAFSEDDFRVLGTLANQLAIAIENTRLLSEARAAVEEVQAVYNEFVRMEWSHTTNKAEQPGFRFKAGRIELMASPLQSEDVLSAMESGTLTVKQANGSGEKRTNVAVPVKVRGEVIGILHIETSDSSRMWKERELSLMEAVAERAAFAMENARLFQEARRRAAKERMISDATSRISGSLNVENILQATALELERVLGGSEVTIRFASKDTA